MRNYFIYYDEKASINYLYLFLFHKIAKIDKATLIHNKIKYNSIQSLTDDLNTAYKNISTDNFVTISKSTLLRVLNSDKEENYFVYNKELKTITLKNNFSNNRTGGKAKFIILNDKEIDFLLLQNNKLLTKYYLFIKYYCGFSGKNNADFTAIQFLEASGYSTRSGDYKTKLSAFNTLLVKEKFISITKFRLYGNERNRYEIL